MHLTAETLSGVCQVVVALLCTVAELSLIVAQISFAWRGKNIVGDWFPFRSSRSCAPDPGS